MNDDIKELIEYLRNHFDDDAPSMTVRDSDVKRWVAAVEQLQQELNETVSLCNEYLFKTIAYERILDKGITVNVNNEPCRCKHDVNTKPFKLGGGNVYAGLSGDATKDFGEDKAEKGLTKEERIKISSSEALRAALEAEKPEAVKVPWEAANQTYTWLVDKGYDPYAADTEKGKSDD